MAEAPQYSHTQKGIIRPTLLISAIICLALACVYQSRPPLQPVFLVGAGISGLMSFSFAYLTVWGPW